jgi:parvulin-like peptidyl-prolyl isomerase
MQNDPLEKDPRKKLIVIAFLALLIGGGFYTFSQLSPIDISEDPLFVFDNNELEEAFNLLTGEIDIVNAEPALIEFKELNTEPNEEKIVWAESQAEEAYQELLNGKGFETLALEEQEAWPDQVTFAKEENIELSQLHESEQEHLKDASAPDLITPFHSTSGYYLQRNGSLAETTGQSLIQVIERSSIETELIIEEEVSARHILISYQGSSASLEVDRNKKEAETLIKELLKRIEDGEDFQEIAKAYSDDSSAQSGGDLGSFGKGRMVAPFEEAAFKLEVDEISEVVETQFGFHLIQVYDKSEASSESISVDTISFNKLTYNTTPEEWVEEATLSNEHVQNIEVMFSASYQPYLQLTFTEEAAPLFTELTERNLGNPIAIFIDGKLISSPTIQAVISGGAAQISGNFTIEEANELAAQIKAGI